jgi:hypothetical protein
VDNIVEQGRLQMITQRKRIACWITRATNRQSGFVIRIVFPLQEYSHERASKLRYTYIASLDIYTLSLIHNFGGYIN